MADQQVTKRERDDDDDETDARKLKQLDDDDKGAGKRWTPEQDEALRLAVEEFGQRNWKSIATRVPGRNHAQCLQRWNKVLKPGLVKGHWSYEEDSTLERMVLQGCHSWSEVAASIPGRTAKQCRERWRNHLDPSINKSPFTPEEDMTIQEAYEHLGNRWTQIAQRLPGRTEDAIKTRWKALNPNQRTNARPGRPRLMPGLEGPRGPHGPPNPEDLAVASMNAAPMQPPVNGGYEFAQPPAQMGQAMPMNAGTMNAGTMNAGMADPMLDPGHEVGGEEAAKDAAMLKELLISHGSSLRSSLRGSSLLMSLGNASTLSSLQDMTPDELLESGGLDELLGAVALVDQDHGGPVPQTTSQRLSELSHNRESLSRALSSMDRHDRHIFQGLMDGLRTNPPDNAYPDNGDPGYAPMNANPNGNGNGMNGMNGMPVSAGDPSMLHSLDFQQQQQQQQPPQQHHQQPMHNVVHVAGNGSQPIVAAVEDSEDIDDILHSGLMQPIRKGRPVLH